MKFGYDYTVLTSSQLKIMMFWMFYKKCKYTYLKPELQSFDNFYTGPLRPFCDPFIQYIFSLIFLNIFKTTVEILLKFMTNV